MASLLVVCTGNVCRSPYVERLLRAALPTEVEVRSAGTRAAVGAAMSAGSVAELVRAGVATDGPPARQVLAADVATSDLVVALAREHRRALVQLHPRATRWTFTLRELARLLEHAPALPGGSPSERLARLAAAVAPLRGMHPPASPDDDDVADPIGLGPPAYARMADEVGPAVRALVGALRGATGAGAGSAP